MEWYLVRFSSYLGFSKLLGRVRKGWGMLFVKLPNPNPNEVVTVKGWESKRLLFLLSRSKVTVKMKKIFRS